MRDDAPLLELRGVAKTFTLHLQGAARLEVVRGVTLTVSAGECVVLAGPSGTGKSSVLRMIYGNYRCDEGEIRLRTATCDLDIARASPREIIALRRTVVGYVSQFLRVIPRVSTLELVSAAARTFGFSPSAARVRGEDLLRRLAVPERLWGLPPATFSGGEQQRVNIAIGFAGDHCIMLLDEPTASLDAANRSAVVGLIDERKAEGKAILGIFHDEDVRNRVADRLVDISTFASVGSALVPRAADGRGSLVLVVGPSGSGKDTLIRAAGALLANELDIVLARRMITRPRDANEYHEPVTVDELEQRRSRGEVALSWSAHGLHYALSNSVDTALANGSTVVCNVSRGVVEAARRRYPRVVVVEVTAPAEILSKRLAERGRETLDDQTGRLQRQPPALFAVDVRIENTGTIEDGAEKLVEAIRSTRAAGTQVIEKLREVGA